MNIPESIRIGGVEYAVTREPFLSLDGRELCGMIDYQQGVIALSDNVAMSHDKECLTLWHEIFHGIAHHFDLDLEDEENVVELFARGVYQVLQDNSGRLFNLREDCFIQSETIFFGDLHADGIANLSKEVTPNEDWQSV